MYYHLISYHGHDERLYLTIAELQVVMVVVGRYKFFISFHLISAQRFPKIIINTNHVQRLKTQTCHSFKTKSSGQPSFFLSDLNNMIEVQPFRYLDIYKVRLHLAKKTQNQLSKVFYKFGVVT